MTWDIKKKKYVSQGFTRTTRFPTWESRIASVETLKKWRDDVVAELSDAKTYGIFCRAVESVAASGKKFQRTDLTSRNGNVSPEQNLSLPAQQSPAGATPSTQALNTFNQSRYHSVSQGAEPISGSPVLSGALGNMSSAEGTSALPRWSSSTSGSCSGSPRKLLSRDSSSASFTNLHLLSQRGLQQVLGSPVSPTSPPKGGAEPISGSPALSGALGNMSSAEGTSALPQWSSSTSSSCADSPRKFLSRGSSSASFTNLHLLSQRGLQQVLGSPASPASPPKACSGLVTPSDDAPGLQRSRVAFTDLKSLAPELIEEDTLSPFTAFSIIQVKIKVRGEEKYILLLLTGLLGGEAGGNGVVKLGVEVTKVAEGRYTIDMRKLRAVKIIYNKSDKFGSEALVNAWQITSESGETIYYTDRYGGKNDQQHKDYCVLPWYDGVDLAEIIHTQKQIFPVDIDSGLSASSPVVVKQALLMKKRMNFLQKLKISIEIIKKLRAIHKDMVHRDIKPENIKILEVALGEFYVFIVDRDQAVEASTTKREFVGTAEYRDPAMVSYRNTNQSYIVSVAHDVFALGVVLLELWTNYSVSEIREQIRDKVDATGLKTLTIRLAKDIDATWHEFYFSDSGMSEQDTSAVYMFLVKAMHQMVFGTVEMRRDLLAEVEKTFEDCLEKVRRWVFVPYAMGIPPSLQGRFPNIEVPITAY